MTRNQVMRQEKMEVIDPLNLARHINKLLS